MMNNTSKYFVLVYTGYFSSVLPVFSLSLWIMTILKHTDDAAIIGNIAVDADSENYLYLDEIDRINLLSTPAHSARTTVLFMRLNFLRSNYF